MKKRRLAVVSALAVAMALLLPTAAFASTGSARQPTLVAASASGPSFNPKLAKCSHVKSATGTVERCGEQQRLPLTDLSPAQRAERQHAMAQFAARSKESRSASGSAKAAIAAPAQCNFSSTEFTLTGVTNPSRFVSCSDVLWTLTQWEITNGVPELIGEFYYEDQAWNLYSVSSLGWEHGMQTLGYTAGAYGTLAEGLVGLLYSNCSVEPGICAATSLTNPDPQFVVINPGVNYSFDWAESDTGPATTPGNEDILDADLGVTWQDTNLGTTGNESGFLAGRCDSMFTNSSGCVDENFTSTLYLSLAKYGASAAMVQFAQENMSAHWGLQGVGSPLTRLASSAVASSNRAAICDKTFVNEGTAIGGNDGDSDSCDEFPFAATYQSGAFAGVTSGSQCAQVTAVQSGNTGNEAADWASVDPVGAYTGNEPCVRGHIPSKLNSGAGGAYGGLITSQRLLDGDPFWVAVTA